MTPRKAAPKVYTYRWTGDYAAVIDGHTTPEGNGVLATPGENFQTIAPLEHVNADPVEQGAEQAPASTPGEEPASEEDAV